jgi:hypothetical protein
VEAGDTAGDITESKDNDKAVMASGDYEKEDKGSNTLLDNPKVKIILAIIGAVLLVLLLLIVAIIVIIARSGVKLLNFHFIIFFLYRHIFSVLFRNSINLNKYIIIYHII